MLPDHNVTLKVADREVTGWESVQIRRSIEQGSGAFELEMPLQSADNWTELALGDRAEIEVNGETVLTGFIDMVAPAYSGDAQKVRVAGRDAVGDLMDCAAIVDGPYEFAGMKLEKAVEKILKPYGIPLKVAADTGASFKRLSIQPGETAFEFIERACRQRAILPLSDGVGGLVLTKPGAVHSGLTVELGRNILSGEADINWTERFSLYVVKGQSEADEESGEEAVSEPAARVSDTTIKRYRPTVILADAQGYDLSFPNRAAWQKQFNTARSKRLSYKLPGWFEGEKLWRPNELVTVKDKILRVERDMLIVALTFERSNQGTVTAMELCLPEAFDLPAEKEQKEDDSDEGDDLWELT